MTELVRHTLPSRLGRTRLCFARISRGLLLLVYIRSVVYNMVPFLTFAFLPPITLDSRSPNLRSQLHYPISHQVTICFESLIALCAIQIKNEFRRSGWLLHLAVKQGTVMCSESSLLFLMLTKPPADETSPLHRTGEFFSFCRSFCIQEQ